MSAITFKPLVARVVRFAAYNPNQKRAPKGTPTGGQWTDDDGSSDTGIAPKAAIAALDKLPESEYDAESVSIASVLSVHDVMDDEDAYLDFQEAFSGEEGESITLNAAEIGKLKAVQSSVTKSHVAALIKSHAQWSKGANPAGESVKIIEAKNGRFISDGHHRAIAAKLLGAGLRVKVVKAPKLSISRGGKLTGIENYLRGLAYNPDQPRAPKGTETGGQWVDDDAPEFPFADDAIMGGTDFDKAAFGELKAAKRWFNHVHAASFQTEGEDDDRQAGILKHQVSMALGAALDAQFDKEKLEQLAVLLGTDEAGRTPGYAVSNALVHGWAATSGDHNPMSVLYQHAVAEELGVDARIDHFFDGAESGQALSAVKALVAEEIGIADRDSHGIDADDVYAMMKVHARAQYDSTQRFLKSQGAPESFTLARGVNIDTKDAEGIARTGRAALQPLSSFTTDLDTASNFAGGSDEHDWADPDQDWNAPPVPMFSRGHIIRATIPRSRIFSMPRTGFGALAEYEVVVLGSKSQPVKIGKRFGKFNRTSEKKAQAEIKAHYDKLGMTEAQQSDPTFIPFQGREAKYNPDQPREPKGDPEGGQWTAISGRAIRGPMRRGTDADRKRLGIPPAYSDVQVTDDPRAELLATARTPKGKIASFYSEAYHEKQAAAKWERITELQRDLPEMLRQVDHAIKNKTEDRDVAMTIRLIAQTGLRNGGDAGEGVGASNLRFEHLTVSGDSVRLQFKGKGGVDQDHTVRDRSFAAYVRERQALRLGDSARLFPHDASDTLAYQKRIGNGRYKVHDLRTYVGTTMASKLTQAVMKDHAPTTQKEYRSALKQIATHVSRKLGNTPSIALSTYIHPTAVEPLRNKVKR